MTETELNTFLDLEWNCAAFAAETESVSAPLSPKQWARIISRHPELQELCPFSEFTPDDWVTVLSGQLPLAWRCPCWQDFTPYQWQKLLLYRQLRVFAFMAVSSTTNKQPKLPELYSTNRLCFITARSRIIRL